MTWTAVFVAISALSFCSGCTAVPTPAPTEKVQTASEAIEIAKKYCGLHNRNDEWTARFSSGTWLVRMKRPTEPNVNSYLIEFIRASDGAGGRCEGLPLVG
jgi:hypothetical protein